MGRTGQAELSFRTWGGRRPGAGRKPRGQRALVAHTPRPLRHRHHPVHVTLRVIDGLPSLRDPDLFAAVRRGISSASRLAFRVVQFSVQSNHVHLLVEAEGTQALSRGMQGLGVRVARAVNRRLARRGRLFADRYHERTLRTPREVRNALVYVLQNGRKHGVSASGVDPCSSGPWFDGWSESFRPVPGRAPVAPAQTWLLRVGWRRHRAIDVNETPTPRRRRSTGRGRPEGPRLG